MRSEPAGFSVLWRPEPVRFVVKVEHRLAGGIISEHCLQPYLFSCSCLVRTDRERASLWSGARQCRVRDIGAGAIVFCGGHREVRVFSMLFGRPALTRLYGTSLSVAPASSGILCPNVSSIFFPYYCRGTIGSDRPAIEDGGKRWEGWKEYRMSRQEGARVT